MNGNLQQLLNSIQQSAHLNDDEKNLLLKTVKDADKELEITAFKLDRTEKVKRTTAILLEETIEELEQKRKAVEAQNKELEIEAALERVRTVAMSMNKPDDMLDVCKTISHQLQLLHVKEIRNVQTAIFYREKGTYMNYEYYAKHNKTLITETSYTNHEMHKAFAAQMLKGQGEFFTTYISKAELPGWLAYQKTTNVFIDTFLETANSLTYYWYSLGPVALGISTYEPLKEEETILFKRFLKVFELSYTRYLDIEQAIAQAREAQIQLALERVRARTMAMQHSNELQDAASLMFQQIESLGAPTWNCSFNIWTEDKKYAIAWNATKEGFGRPFYSPSSEDVFLEFYAAAQQGKELFIKEIGGTELEQHYQYLSTVPGVGETLAELKAAGVVLPTYQVFNIAYFTQGYLMFITYQLVPELAEILKRFAKVFEQTYTRFLDLQKAEAQSRESEIELALERVRARTMAMKHSDELAEASLLLDKQVRALGIPTRGCGFNIYGDNESTEWFSSEMGTMPTYKTPREKLFLRYYEEGKKGKPIHIESFAGEACAAHYEYLMTIPIMGDGLKQLKASGGSFPEQQVDHVTYFKYGYLLFITLEPAPEAHDIFIRFAKVFEQTYTRFLDLQKAEAQARESQVQLALERVRARTMAMHQSNELANTASILFQQIKELGFETWSCGFCIWKENDLSEVWMAADSGGLLPPMMIPYKEELTHAEIYNASLRGEPAHHKIWEGKELEKHYAFLKTIPSVKTAIDILEKSGLTLPERQCYYVGFFKEGYLLLITKEPNEGLKDLSKRFASVFDLTYTRFLDLQKAEAQSREAQIEAALERVRSRTLAMQKSDELAETAAVLFKQLIILGIEPNRLYISIIKDKEGETEFWITDEDGSKVSMAYEDNLNNNPSFKKMFDGWKQQRKSLVIDMKGEELDIYFDYLNSIHVPFKGGSAQKRRLQYIAYFSKGFIGMASPDEQPGETMLLLERFAAVFNLTFTRFNDLKIAEAHAVQAAEDLIKLQTEKARAEDALTELKETQKQLIQSEKMASLGELTAGIAHEIQNPLNFVNNFSEVSKELLDEMKTALESGDEDEAREIVNDVIQNLEKINHHGKRADAIVKGMLQHSRKSSGQKEPTDINALCDEYIRLCYHGLRAKDKSFNANINIDFDTTIEKINVIPQDISRVMLNVLTNAFYAVHEKKKAADESYKPTVSIQTKKINDNIEISVKDNGNGIPKSIIDKIFQPFFTTKPTGEGTGLGLSLAYDIITKEHNGAIKLESKEGEGATFIIQLPKV